jgi:hypothetical protein
MKTFSKEIKVYSVLKSLAVEAFKFAQVSTETTVRILMRSTASRIESNFWDERYQ